jgi:A/G-specific adenine glycosylase
MNRVPARTWTSKLLRWYEAHHRDLPWRRTQDPYRIWLSEIMLQQTRAQAVIPYYQKFLERFPTTAALARAPETAVLACWSGLGYYSRARNLHRAARLMSEGFPDSYDAIRRLPGVGDYTAAAIASIAFGLPYAVLDGNVMRVIARLTNDAADIGTSTTRARFRQIAQHWLDPRRPGGFNQAMMELGATVCLPKAPRCAACPLAQACEARRLGLESQLPVKLRKETPQKIDGALVVAQRRGRILLWQRTADSRRMAGFWELPSREQLPELHSPRLAGSFRHTITHHRYAITVWSGSVTRAAPPLQWRLIRDLHLLALSTMSKKALRLAGIGGTSRKTA